MKVDSAKKLFKIILGDQWLYEKKFCIFLVLKQNVFIECVLLCTKRMQSCRYCQYFNTTATHGIL